MLKFFLKILIFVWLTEFLNRLNRNRTENQIFFEIFFSELIFWFDFFDFSV